MVRMGIGELSRRSGVSPRLLRYYEEQGLLAPERLASGYRAYTEDDVDTVRRIRMLLAAGLNTATIAGVLPCVTDTDGALAPGCAGVADDLRRERARLDQAVADLLAARDTLDGILTGAPAGDAARPSPVDA
jgi:DNA-binding transcriptional MerR regulator